MGLNFIQVDLRMSTTRPSGLLTSERVGGIEIEMRMPVEDEETKQELQRTVSAPLSSHQAPSTFKLKGPRPTL